MNQVFISFSSSDRDYANAVHDTLVSRNITCWYAPHTIPAGAYGGNIRDGIRHCRVFVIILSPNSDRSQHVKREVSLAADQEHTLIIPFQIDELQISDDLDYFIHNLHWVKANVQSRDASLENLAEYVQEALSRDNRPSEVQNHYKGTLDQKELEKINQVYVPFPQYNNAKKTLAERNILILYGQRLNGKYTTGIHLLSQLVRGEIHQIYPDFYGQFDEYFIDHQAGYIIDGIMPDCLNQLDEAALDLISTKLKSLESYLVITVNLEHCPCGKWNLLCEPPKDKYTLLNNHLRYYTNQNLADVPELNQQTFKEFIQMYLVPREADNMAMQIKRMIDGEVNLEDVSNSLKSSVDKQVQELFKKHPGVNEYLSFMTALAVFETMPYTFVLTASNRLTESLKNNRFMPGFDTAAASEVETSLPSSRLASFQAEIYQGYKNTETGICEIDCVRFQNPAFSRSVLSYIYGMIELREPILHWLRDFRDQKGRIPVSVVHAVSELARLDFNYVKDEIIRPWAASSEQPVRFSAVKVLSRLSTEKEFIPKVSRLLHHWSKLRSNEALNWTALHVYGTNICINTPKACLDDLYYIVSSKNISFLNVIYPTIRKIFAYGKIEKRYSIWVLKWLLEWYQLKKGTASCTEPLKLFIRLASITKYEEDRYVPWLLKLALNKTLRKNTINPLFTACLNYLNIKNKCFFIIEVWIIDIGQDTKLNYALDALLLESYLAGSEIERKQIAKALDEWLLDERNQVNAYAKKILNILQ